jgi:uncharacterized protein (DUF952 family)
MPARVFHLAEPAAWDAAQAIGRVVPASLEREGFVHCSTLDQLVGTIERHFSDASELLLLQLAVDRLGPDLRWEESRPGEVYPHLYRPIDVDEIDDVVRWQRAADGSVALPPGLAIDRRHER